MTSDLFRHVLGMLLPADTRQDLVQACDRSVQRNFELADNLSQSVRCANEIENTGWKVYSSGIAKLCRVQVLHLAIGMFSCSTFCSKKPRRLLSNKDIFRLV